MHVYRAFSVPIFGISPGQGFPAIARGTLIFISFFEVLGPF
jgi:hypothetical protein